MILVRKTAEEASFASQINVGFGTRVDLRRDMDKDRAIGFILRERKNRVPRPGGFSPRHSNAKKPQNRLTSADGVWDTGSAIKSEMTDVL